MPNRRNTIYLKVIVSGGKSAYQNIWRKVSWTLPVVPDSSSGQGSQEHQQRDLRRRLTLDLFEPSICGLRIILRVYHRKKT